MPERFNLPPIFNTLYKNVEADKYTSSKKLTSTQRIAAWVYSYPTKVWVGFYAVLFLVVIGTAVFLETTGIAHTIMENARRRTSQEYHALKTIDDNSSVRISTSTGLVALVTDPKGRLVGDTAEGVRHYELVNTTLTSPSNFDIQEILGQNGKKSWGLLISAPDDGQYNIEFSAKLPGTYHFTVTTTNKLGTASQDFSDSVEIKQDQIHRYALEFYKINDNDTNLVFRNTFYRN